MMNTLTAMPSWAHVASSCVFIWTEPSPAMQTTVSSGQPTFAPIAAGRPKPIVPRPPELIQRRGSVEVEVLRRPHLVLADVGGDDRVAAGRLVERLDHALRA